MNVFAKIFSQIFDSSISSDHVVRHVFMDLLVLADRDGVVDMTLDAISRRTNVPEEMVAHAIAELMKDDRKSRSHEEGGRRLIPIDSHRDWGWQIVNYEHYRNIRDEEARRTYFRDKQREHRAKTTPPLSNVVKDNTTPSNLITQGEGEGEGEEERDREREKRAGNAPVTPEIVTVTPPYALDSESSIDSGSELMLSCWLLEELGVPADNATRRIAADAIRLLAKEGGTTKTAADYILAAAIQARNSGETINRFWFTDQKYRPQPPPKSKRQREKDARREAFLAGTEGDHE
jgi:hypothetical protein